MRKHNVSERRACRALNINRSGVRYKVVKLPDEDALTEAIIKRLVNMEDMGTGESQNFYEQKAGISTTRELREFGVNKDLKFLRSSLRRSVCLTMTVM